MKRLFLCFTLASFVLAGCKKQNVSKSSTLVESADSLVNSDTLYTTDELFIQNIDIKNGRIALQNINSNIAFIFLDKDCNSIEDSIIVGSGPNDVVSGRFIKTFVNSDNNSFVICDGSVGKILKVKSTPEIMVSPESNPGIIHLGEPAFGDSMFAGHKLESPYLFTISGINGGDTDVDYYLTMSDEIKKELSSYDMIMRHSIAVNPNKNRILAFSFFFDAIAVYDTDGKLIRTNRNAYDVSEELGAIQNRGEYWSYCLPYATDVACYVKVIKYVDNKNTEMYLNKYDWDGEFIKSYSFPKNAVGGYAIGGDSELYCIVSDIEGTNEYYHVVLCELK